MRLATSPGRRGEAAPRRWFEWLPERKFIPMAQCALIVGLAVAYPDVAVGQILSGILVESASERAIAGAQLTLHDKNERRVALGFSDSTGSFSLRAPHAGAYSLHVNRIGYMPLVLRVHFDSARTLVRRFEVPTAPVELSSVVAERARSCTGPRLSSEEALLWEDIRKAFETVISADDLPRISYTAVEYTRNIDRWKKVQAADTAAVALVGARGPYRSLPVDSLLNFGFVQPDPATGAFAWFGPDAEVLLSPEFLDAYCFEHAPTSGHAGQVGLRYRATTDDTITGIRGTIWADSASRELRAVEFQYNRLPVNDPEIDAAGGVVEFSRIPNGPWIVTRWVLTAPRFVEQPLPNGKGIERFFTTYRQLERVVIEGRYADGRVAYRRPMSGN